ncbi:hypothetical protein [Halopenitus persicus]|uniref:hypothetical protein n=1 Tax=Halopenitus persicus TaxID=1048396 RepID=UPI000BBA4BB7|nr:hypothetical protein [Halopenitus persicus]
MTDTPAEIIDVVRRARETGSQVRIETDDGRVVDTVIAAVDVDSSLAEETRHDPPHGEFAAILLPGGLREIEDWEVGGMVYTIEADGGGWRAVTVSWVTEVDETGQVIDEYTGEVVTAEVVSDE